MRGELPQHTFQGAQRYPDLYMDADYERSTLNVLNSTVASSSSPPDLPTFPSNAIPPIKLDVLEPSQWDELETFLSSRDEGNDDGHIGDTSSESKPNDESVVDGIVISE